MAAEYTKIARRRKEQSTYIGNSEILENIMHRLSNTRNPSAMIEKYAVETIEHPQRVIGTRQNI